MKASVHLALVLACVAVASCRGSHREEDTLSVLWTRYVDVYIEPSGKVMDARQQRVTSEGQSYAMLRAVLQRDRETFETVYRWTKEHLKRNDGLYAWLWDPEKKAVTDKNTATDADQDIALALILAADAFGEPRYLEEATELVLSIRRHTGIEISGGWLPSAGNWAVEERVVNLSYFYPYAYEYFSKVDPEGGWDVAVVTGYDLLTQVLSLPGVKLPPDFMEVNEKGQVVLLPEDSVLSGDFSFDAMRIYWRAELDCKLTGRGRACSDPVHVSNLSALLRRDGMLYTRYTVAGVPLTDGESTSFYGSLLPVLLHYAPDLAQSVRREKLSKEQLERISEQSNRYYDLNWIWFGLALADGFMLQRMPPPSFVSR